MTRPRLLALVLGLSLGWFVVPSKPTLAQAPVRAKRVIVREVKPAPPGPQPTPPAWDQADEIGNGGYVPDGPEAHGEIPSGINNADPGELVEATKTVWAQAGSRSWSGCSSMASEAAKQLWGYSEDVNNFRENHHWAIRASECPNAPEVLAMAARSELLRRFDLPEAVDESSDLSLVETGVIESRDHALAWIEAALAEQQRRRDKRGLGLEYWRGRALLSTGDLVGARTALRRALARASVEGWKLRRLLALTELYAGDLDAALDLAKRAFIDAPDNDRIASYYVLALVLDRAGDQAGARRRMQTALDRDEGSILRALETAMPLHERLYARAYAKTVRRETSGALRVWNAYLARPEPEDPERRLAERHQAALRPLPSNLGGPAHANEGAAAGAQP